MEKQVSIIPGGVFQDDRGRIDFCNAFDLSRVKRFYSITHTDISVVRAWQGHRLEQKWFYVLRGSFRLAWVKIDDWELPSQNLVAEEIILRAGEPEVVAIPAGYANGFKALEADSQLMVFSDFNLEESAKENIRFPQEMWMEW